MSSVGQAFDDALGSLREKYVARLAGVVSELNQFAVLCEFEEARTDATAAIGRLAHKLTGSGHTLGFPEVSACAAKLEALIETETSSLEVLAAGARALARACGAATQATRDSQIVEAADASGTAAESIAGSRPVPQFAAWCTDPGLAQLLQDVFESRATIRRCNTSRAAFEAAGDSGIALLFVDLDNPECRNEAIAELYRTARATNIGVLAFTASRRSAAVATAVSDSGIDCLLKPVDPAALYKKVFQALGRARRIAVICDDDRVVREFLKLKFEASGFEVHLAKDGEEVIALARRLQPSIIVLDRAMPKVEGIAALRMLKGEASTHDIPVVMLTAMAQPHEVTEGLKSGAAAYLVKPFAPATVVTKCLEILGAAPKRRRD